MRPPVYDHGRVVELRKQGLTYHQIAKEIGCDKSSVSRILSGKLVYMRNGVAGVNMLDPEDPGLGCEAFHCTVNDLGDDPLLAKLKATHVQRAS